VALVGVLAGGAIACAGADRLFYPHPATALPHCTAWITPRYSSILRTAQPACRCEGCLRTDTSHWFAHFLRPIFATLHGLDGAALITLVADARLHGARSLPLRKQLLLRRRDVAHAQHLSLHICVAGTDIASGAAPHAAAAPPRCALASTPSCWRGSGTVPWLFAAFQYLYRHLACGKGFARGVHFGGL